MSGSPRVDGWALSPERLVGVPVAVAHGSPDPVILARFGEETADVLEAAGVDVLRLVALRQHMVNQAWLLPLRKVVARAILP